DHAVVDGSPQRTQRAQSGQKTITKITPSRPSVFQTCLLSALCSLCSLFYYRSESSLRAKNSKPLKSKPRQGCNLRLGLLCVLCDSVLLPIHFFAACADF